MKKKYNKLVRDRIPKIIEADGHTCKYHVASEKEIEGKLRKKLQEEIDEFLENPCAEEVADILEILETTRKHYGISLDEVKYQKESKLVNRGGFSGHFILEWTEEK